MPNEPRFINAMYRSPPGARSLTFAQLPVMDLYLISVKVEPPSDDTDHRDPFNSQDAYYTNPLAQLKLYTYLHRVYCSLHPRPSQKDFIADLQRERKTRTLSTFYEVPEAGDIVEYVLSLEWKSLEGRLRFMDPAQPSTAYGSWRPVPDDLWITHFVQPLHALQKADKIHDLEHWALDLISWPLPPSKSQRAWNSAKEPFHYVKISLKFLVSSVLWAEIKWRIRNRHRKAK